ncbi:GTPase HflX [Streptococcus halichoeri]|uniref:GTPase HflX n=1 Tax=Streptococcus halichoeri TaxID=254785 RepID=UPI001357E140|nr:GTPase HflX [Streptococcus halichoeri]
MSLIETQNAQERVVLVGVALPDTQQFEMSMIELASLAQTAGAEVVASYEQKRKKYDSKTLVGAGKLSEISARVAADAIDMVIVNNRLTPRQNSHLEAELGVKVIDRMQLILDIFAMRAHSHEGKLQVHLAQLKYLLPRLMGQGILLSRQAGGIGSRGPGESQLELNRRSIRQQIADIEHKLKQVEQNRQITREKRLTSEPFRIGLIGYTNAGKSTIMNLMTDHDHYEADELFATLDATTKQLYLQDHFQATLTDTVGFIQDLPTELVAAFKSTLEESRHLDLLLHVIDASDPHQLEQEQVVLEILRDLGMQHIPRLTIYNKMDLAQAFTASAFPNIQLSAHDHSSRKRLRTWLVEQICELFIPFSISVDQADFYKLYELQKVAFLDAYHFEQRKENIKGYIASKNKWRLEGFYD